jgi:hypothetical protein
MKALTGLVKGPLKQGKQFWQPKTVKDISPKPWEAV